jgi:predicted enzyme related to lactoylglutathione lyase
MLTDNPLVAFVGTTDRARAKEFYASILGLKLTSPGGARVAWFRDPDGNVLSISQAPG